MMVPRGVEVFELFSERMKKKSDNGMTNDEEEKQSLGNWEGKFRENSQSS
jgi:hypothetical protein